MVNSEVKRRWSAVIVLVMKSSRLFSLVLATLVAGFFLVGAHGGPVQAQDLDSISFTTPSKNIDCLLFDLDGSTSGNCVVKSAAWKKLPAIPSDCDLDWAATEVSVFSEKSGATLTNSVALGSCRGDVGPLCGPTCPVLAYGKSFTLRSIKCTSTTKGVTCVTTSGPKRGFTVNRAGYTLIR